MASRIESDSPSKALRRQAESNAAASASSKPTVPGSPLKPIPKRAALPPVTGQPETAAAEDREAPARRGFFGQIPGWGISVIVHVIALLLMALMAGESVRIEKPTVITSSVSEAEEDIADLELEQPVPEEVSEVTDPVEVTMPEMAITPEVTVDAVVPVEVVSSATDVDAAPLAAIDASDFGADLPLQAGSAAEGGPGGMAGGLGGRGKPGQMAAKRGGGADTEAAVDRALKWLAAHQLPDGGWDFDLANCKGCTCEPRAPKQPENGVGRAAATALALLPFLGRGYTHREGPYRKEVEAGIRFLLDDLTASQSRGKQRYHLYVQGIMGIVLSECYAMSRDDALAAPAQTVLNGIMEAQAEGGGWAYWFSDRRLGGDISSTGWQIMALKSGDMASLQINPLTVKKAVEFLDAVQADEQGATYRYRPSDEPIAGPTPGRNAIGLLCRMYLGWKKDHPGLQQGAIAIATKGPTNELYYDYYATQVMHHLEGDMWFAWNTKMKALLLGTQATQGHEAGSWFEGVNGGDSHNAVGAGGRLYSTVMATLILEVYYRHLPLFSTQSVKEKFRD
jgi:hypothetical protein